MLVIASESEAIHAAACCDMDCFVASLLAMTKGKSERRRLRHRDREPAQIRVRDQAELLAR
jgi:hypothetical protein